ncbi:MAG: FtsQ-type POTRA domain-containing protein [Tenericutes bacterium]|nr:FtsQ-type POTRA domain-containing protein [Mycoplasmatota bacterium]
MKKNKKKKKLNIIKLLVFILIFYIIIYSIYSLLNMKIRNIVIKGNTYLKDYEIIEQANIKDYPPMLTLNKNKTINKLKELDLISDATIKKSFDFTLTIEVVEKKIILEYDNNYYLSDGSKIKGSYLGTPTLVNYVPEGTLKKFLNEMGKLDYDIINSISEIEYSPTKNSDGNITDEDIFIFKMNDGMIVYISTDKIDIMNKYQKIYASLGDKKGILHLDKGNYLEVQ